jgi:hypothetical protein
MEFHGILATLLRRWVTNFGETFKPVLPRRSENV